MPSTNPTAVVIHWNELEIQDRIGQVESLEWDVVGSEHHDLDRGIETVGQTAPDALVLWLSNRPEDGRALALRLRGRAWEEGLPLVCVDGSPHAVERMQEVQPHAVFTDVYHLEDALKEAQRMGKKLDQKAKKEREREAEA